MEGKRIVILGAGFAGLQAARRLRKTRCDITLIDRYNFHQFQPLFYQVATARLEPSAISFPLRKIFQRRKNVHVRMGEVVEIDGAAKTVRTDIAGDFPYDYLVIATGCTNNFFGSADMERFSFPMKSTPEAIALRNRILTSFEDAVDAPPEELGRLLNIVIVGGGPTGVELAGAIAEMKQKVLPKDYPDMDFSKLGVYLVENSPTTLSNMSEGAQKKSQEYLEAFGVQVLTGVKVSGYDGGTATLSDGRSIPTRTLIWAAGVKGNVPPGVPAESVVRGGRIATDPEGRVQGMADIFAVGDIAHTVTPDWPQGFPQLGNVAVNQGKHLARNLKRLQAGEALKPFAWKNPGTMATVGKRRAVVDLPWWKFQGVFAWFVWMFLHLMLILSVRNKLLIFINWAISYVTNDTTLRLILLPTRKQVELAKEHGVIE